MKWFQQPRFAQPLLPCWLWFAWSALAATSVAEETWTAFAIYPPEIRLDGAEDYQHFIAVASRSDGVTLDITDQVTWRVADDSKARMDGGRLVPISDGETMLAASWQGMSQEVPIRVFQASETKPVGFQLDIMPILTRSSCNTGSCHGAARGKDGFRLSLFGFDPAGDFQRITREIGIRRINLAVPEESLILLKATGAVPHSGGKRIDPGSVHYRKLLSWLQAGAPRDSVAPPAVSRVDIYPPQAVIEGEGGTQRTLVVATYADGTTRDVQDLAGFSTNNERTAAVDKNGLITGGVRGEAFVMARFDTHTVGLQVLALPANLDYQTPESVGNYIDFLVNQKLEKLRLLPSERCTDEEFLRRVTIDITGLLPTEEEYHAFLKDTSPDKRAKKIDALLEKKEFSEIWAMKWAELLMIKSSNQVSYKAAFLYNSWLTNQIASNVPIDEIVRKIIASTGGVFNNPETNFYQIEADTLKTAENVAQVFMGIRTQCAQCHNHPFDRWTMDDYYGFAAFFAQIGRKTGEDYRETIVFDRRGGEVRHPVTGANALPKFLGAPTPEIKNRERREVLAQWITSAENPFFSKSIANRIWAYYMGRGIVDPVDDFRISNPASNPELLDELARRLIEYQFDFKKLVRDICNSHAYQRSALTNENNRADEVNYSHFIVRRVPAENLLDCISQATATKDKFRGLPLGAKAVQIADGTTSNYFLTSFGRSPRNTVCANEASTDPSLSQALHLLNGDSVHGKIAQGRLVPTMLEQGRTAEEIIERIYIRCLSRTPTPAEREKLLKIAAESNGNTQEGLEDIFWGVLNSREFIFNH